MTTSGTCYIFLNVIQCFNCLDLAILCCGKYVFTNGDGYQSSGGFQSATVLSAVASTNNLGSNVTILGRLGEFLSTL